MYKNVELRYPIDMMRYLAFLLKENAPSKKTPNNIDAVSTDIK